MHLLNTRQVKFVAAALDIAILIAFGSQSSGLMCKWYVRTMHIESLPRSIVSGESPRATRIRPTSTALMSKAILSRLTTREEQLFLRRVTTPTGYSKACSGIRKY